MKHLTMDICMYVCMYVVRNIDSVHKVYIPCYPYYVTTLLLLYLISNTRRKPLVGHLIFSADDYMCN